MEKNPCLAQNPDDIVSGPKIILIDSRYLLEQSWWNRNWNNELSKL